MYEWLVNVEGVLNRLNDAVSTLQNHRENDAVTFRSSTSLARGMCVCASYVQNICVKFCRQKHRRRVKCMRFNHSLSPSRCVMMNDSPGQCFEGTASE